MDVDAANSPKDVTDQPLESDAVLLAHRMSRLARKNPHPLDCRTKFYEEEHRYVLLPPPAPPPPPFLLDDVGHSNHSNNANDQSEPLDFPLSVTALVHQAFPSTFDAKAVVDAHLVKWSNNPSSKYFDTIQELMLQDGFSLAECGEHIMQSWNQEGKRAREMGTQMHFELEKWMNRDLDDDKGSEFADCSPCHVDTVKMVSVAMRGTFYPDMKLVPFRSEFRVFLDAEVSYKGETRRIPIVSGTIDGIFVDSYERLWIVDWKRIDANKKGRLRLPSSRSSFATCGVRGFDGFTNCDFLSYSLQLVLYSLILERGNYFPDREIAGLFLCQVHQESMSQPHFVQAMQGLSHDAQLKFENAAAALLDAHTEACIREAEDEMRASQSRKRSLDEA